MSTDPTIHFLSFDILQSNLFHLAGLFGGFMPLIVDLIQRQNQAMSKRVPLDCGYFFLKVLIIPFCALVITGFAVSSENVTTWLAALYLGASFPMLAQKAVSIKNPLEKTGEGA